MGWIDIVVIALVVLSAIIGLAKGLFESILSLFGTGLSLGIAIWASKPVANFISGIVNVNEFIVGLLEKYGVAEDGVVKILMQNFAVEQAADFLTIVASVILVFILIKLVIWLLAKLFDSATSNSSALSGLNRLLGLVFGAAKGLVFVGIGLAIASLVGSVAFTEQINTEIQKNQITSFVYNYVDNWVEDTLEDQLRKLIGEPEENEETVEATPITETVVEIA